MTTFAITRPYGAGVERVRLVITDVPDELGERDVLDWLDDCDPCLDAATPEDEWSSSEQLTAREAPVVRWRGRPGRPEIGPVVNVRLDTELLARIDALAAGSGESRAATIRGLLAREVSGAQTVTPEPVDVERRS